MTTKTKMPWTDHTFNPWGGQGPGVLAAESSWRQPLAWDRRARREGRTHRVCCGSLADPFLGGPGQMTRDHDLLWWHSTDGLRTPSVCQGTPPLPGSLPPHPEWLPYTLQQARQRLWLLIEKTPDLDWQLLTKRPQDMRPPFVPLAWDVCGWPTSIWAMTSVEDQATADQRIPALLRVPASIRAVSALPLLGPIQLTRTCGLSFDRYPDHTVAAGALDWVLLGGESGPHARPCHLEWLRALVRQCHAADVPCFVQQLGSRPVYTEQISTGPVLLPWDCNDPSGSDPAEWPRDLRVQELPR